MKNKIIAAKIKLRQRAESKIKSNTQLKKSKFKQQEVAIANLSIVNDELQQAKVFLEKDHEANTLKLIHELEVHQIELDMQQEELFQAKEEDIEKQNLIYKLEEQKIELAISNIELLLAKERAEVASIKFTELYEFAPSGYMTLSREGIIIEINLNGALLLNSDRSKLLNGSFVSIVKAHTFCDFNLFLASIFDSVSKKICELQLSTTDSSIKHLHLTGIISNNRDQCLISIVDVSERKLDENLMKEKMEEMERFHRLLVGRELTMIDLKKEVNELLVTLGNERKYTIVG